jgi:hypothetical protein
LVLSLKDEEEELLSTSSISIIENENVAKQIAGVMESSKKVNKQPTPQNYRDVANIMRMFDVPDSTVRRMGTTEFTLKGLYSRTLEQATYATSELTYKGLAMASKLAGLDDAASYFQDRVAAAQLPPVTGQFNEQIGLLLDEAHKKGKFHEAAANIGWGVMEALAFLTRAAVVKGVPGIGKATPSGVGIPKEAAQMFTGLGTLSDVKRHAAILGTMGVFETPGDLATRLKGALFRIAYNITPFIANATPFTGWGARATDTMLNMFLSSDSYVKAFQSAKDPGEFFVNAIPEFMSDVIFALKTTGSPMNQRIGMMGRTGRFVNMTRAERMSYVKMADKMAEPIVDYGAEPKPVTGRKEIIKSMETHRDLLKVDEVEKKLGSDLKTDEFSELIRKAEEVVGKAETKYPSHTKGLTKTQVKNAIKTFRVETCIKSMEKSGVVPDYVRDKITNEVKSWWQDSRKAIKTYWSNNRLVENIAGLLDRGNPYGANWRVIYGDMNDAQSKELTGNHTRVDAIRDFGEKAFGKKGLAEMFTKRRAVGRFNLTDNDILGVHMGSYDKGVVRHLVRGNGFTGEEIAKCNDIVLNDPKLKSASDWLFAKYVDDYAPLAIVYKTMTGKDLPKRPFYIHIPVDMKNTTFEGDNIAEQMMQRNKMGDHAYIKQGIVTARTYSGKPIGIGAFSNYLKYTQESEHYKAFARPVKSMSDLIGDSRYKEAINRNLGHDAWQVLDKYLKDVAGTKQSTNWDALEKPAMILRRHAGLALIGANLLSAMRQPLSAMQAAAEVGMYHVLNGMQQVGINYEATRDFVYSRAPQIKYRSGLFERFMAEEKATEKAPTVITGKMTRQKAFMYMVTTMDKWTVIAVWKGTYDRVMTTGKTIDGDRIDNDNLERVAIAEADRVVRKTQPAATAKDLPTFHRGGPLAKLFTMFQNQTNKNLNYFDYEIRYKLQTGKITPQKAAYKVLFSYVLPAMMLGMVARGRFPRSKEDIAKDLIKYPLSGAFLIGGMMNWLIDGYSTDYGTPVSIGPTAGLKGVRAFTKGDWENGTRLGIQATATMTGIPYNQLYRSWKGTLALMNNETDDWRRLVWSEYALEQGLPTYAPASRTKRKGR